MITVESKLYVTDNSGAYKVKCIRLLSGLRKKAARIGHFLIIVVPHRKATYKYISQIINLSILITQKKMLKRPMGYYVNYFENRCVILNDNGELIGTKILSILDLRLLAV